MCSVNVVILLSYAEESQIFGILLLFVNRRAQFIQVMHSLIGTIGIACLHQLLVLSIWRYESVGAKLGRLWGSEAIVIAVRLIIVGHYCTRFVIGMIGAVILVGVVCIDLVSVDVGGYVRILGVLGAHARGLHLVRVAQVDGSLLVLLRMGHEKVGRTVLRMGVGRVLLVGGRIWVGLLAGVGVVGQLRGMRVHARGLVVVKVRGRSGLKRLVVVRSAISQWVLVIVLVVVIVVVVVVHSVRVGIVKIIFCTLLSVKGSAVGR